MKNGRASAILESPPQQRCPQQDSDQETNAPSQVGDLEYISVPENRAD